MNHGVALFPFATFYSEDLLNIFLVHKVISCAKVVAKWRGFTRDTNIIGIELWFGGVAEHPVGDYRAKLKRSDLSLHTLLGTLLSLVNKSLTNLFSLLHSMELMFIDEIVLVAISCVGWILMVGGSKAIANSDTL